MKTKLYSLVACLGALSLAACVTSVSDDDGGGGSGNTGNSGTGNSGTGNSSSGGSDTGGSDTGGADTGGGGAGGAGGGTCVYCADSLSDAESPFCDAQAEELYNAFAECVCNGGCAAECGDNLCDTGDATQACLDCFNTGCQQSFNDCANDVN